MKHLIFALALLATPALAEAPQLPDDAVLVEENICNDRESQERGKCGFWIQPNGDVWVVFSQKDETMFIRWLQRGEPYVTVWMNPLFSAT
jgi:hypothetical protein